MTGRDSFVCCGVRVDGLGPESTVRALVDSRYGVARGAHLCNSYTLALALRDHDYRDALNQGDLNLADGFYVAKVGRWRGHRDMTARAYGPEIMFATIDRGRERGLRHYLYGASPKTVARLAEVLRERYPGVQIVGTESPPFRPLNSDEERDLAARVEQARPDIMWVGIGTPRQDYFVAQYTPTLRCTIVPVGAAFDFNAGTKKSAPALVKRAGFEWLYRFFQEPRRLWRRYLIGIPTFVGGVLTDGLRRAPQLPAQPTLPGAATAPAPRHNGEAVPNVPPQRHVPGEVHPAVNDAV